jgi:hypothetical protein
MYKQRYLFIKYDLWRKYIRRLELQRSTSNEISFVGSIDSSRKITADVLEREGVGGREERYVFRLKS